MVRIIPGRPTGSPGGFCLEKLHLYPTTVLGIMSVGMSSARIVDDENRLLAGGIT